MEWQVDLGRRHPGAREKAVVGALVAAVGGYLLFRGPQFHPNTAPAMALLGLATILAQTAELFLPIRYRLDAEGARSQCGPVVTAILWADVRRLIFEPDGVRLSPLAQPSRLDAFRGVRLRFASNKDEVLDTIRELWNGYDGILGARPDA